MKTTKHAVPGETPMTTVERREVIGYVYADAHGIGLTPINTALCMIGDKLSDTGTLEGPARFVFQYGGSDYTVTREPTDSPRRIQKP